LQFVVSS